MPPPTNLPIQSNMLKIVQPKIAKPKHTTMFNPQISSKLASSGVQFSSKTYMPNNVESYVENVKLPTVAKKVLCLVPNTA